MKKIATLFMFVLFLFTFLNCRNEEKQNLDISVSGKVTNQNGTAVPNVKVHAYRGKIGNYAPTIYSDYEFVTTDSNGNYKYTVKNDTYMYKICCEVPSGYTTVTPGCKEVDHSIIDSHTVPNVINFTLKN